MIKRFLPALVFIIIFGIFAFFFVRDYFQKEAAQQQRAVLPSLKLPVYNEGTFPINSQLKREEIKIPATLPAYTVKKTPLTSDQAASIAQSLGFTSSELSVEDPEHGNIHIWFEENGSLNVAESLRTVAYKNYTQDPTNVSASAQFPAEEEIKRIATDFLQSKKVLLGQEAALAAVEYMLVTDDNFAASSREDGDLANVLFDVKVGGAYPILNTLGDKHSVSVKLNKSGGVFSVDIQIAEALDEQGKYPIKTFDQLQQSLPEAKIQGVDPGIIPFISEATISKASLAYLVEQNTAQTILQPIFVLEGDAIIQNQKTPALFYLPAVANPQP